MALEVSWKKQLSQDCTLRTSDFLSQLRTAPVMFPEAATKALGIQAAMECFQFP